MKKLLYKFILFTILLFLASYLFSIWVGFTYERLYFTKTKWVLGLKNKQKDNVFLGSSRIANMVDVKTFDQIVGEKSINIATSGAGYAENLLMLHDYMIKNSKPKTLIIQFDAYEIFDSVPYPNAEVKNDPLFFKRFEMKELISFPYAEETFSEYCTTKEFLILKYLPFYSYILYNQKYTFWGLISPKRKNIYEVDTSCGSSLIKDMVELKNFKKRSGDNILFLYNLNYLKKILDFCRKNEIQVALITPPYYKQLFVKSEVFLNALKELKSNFDFEYFDFSNNPEWNNAEYFVDHIHTNKEGSEVFTKLLADSVLRNNKN